MLQTLHRISGLVAPKICKTVIIYAYKAHRHKTVCLIKLSRIKCASEEIKALQALHDTPATVLI